LLEKWAEFLKKNKTQMILKKGGGLKNKKFLESEEGNNADYYDEFRKVIFIFQHFLVLERIHSHLNLNLGLLPSYRKT
jgi:hypothetical protein